MAGGREEVNTVRSCLRLGPGTTQGAEASPVGALLEKLGEESGPAVFASLLYRSPAASGGANTRDEKIAVWDEVRASTRHVAAMAGGNQVGQLVVPPVPVDVVNDEIVPHGRSPYCPVNLFTAPVAWVRPRTDRVVKGNSVWSNSAARRSQGMIWGVCREVPIGHKRARVALRPRGLGFRAACHMAGYGAEYADGLGLGSVSFDRISAGKAGVDQLSSDVRRSFSHVRESTLYAPAMLAGLTKIGESKCLAAV